MIWSTVAVIALSLLAGVGVKWAVDRIWPRELLLLDRATKSLQLAVELLDEPLAAIGKHTYTQDHTLDVLADGMEAGRRSERLGQERNPFATAYGHNWQPGVAQPGGGWLSGPMLDEAFSLPRPDGEQPVNGADLS